MNSYDLKLRSADAAVQKLLDRFAADPIYFVLGGPGWAGLTTKDEHDQVHSRKSFPDKSYLRWVLNEWHTGPNVLLTAKSRQLMISWLLAAYALWTIMFRSDALVLWQSKKQEDAAPFIYEKTPQHARLSLMMAELPDYLRCCRTSSGTYIQIPDVSEVGSYAAITLPNGSQALGLAQGASQVESRVPTLFVSDESSLQEEWSNAMAAAKPAIERDAKILAVGTMRPSDFGEAIAPSWAVDHDACGRGLSRFTSPDGIAGIRVHYSADPDKDPATEVGAAWKRGQLESGAYRGGEKGHLWRSHLEIDPLARAGTLCIPAFRHIQHLVVAPDIAHAATYGWAFEAGLDWGVRNRAVFLLFGMRPDGRRFLLREISVPGKDCGGIPGFCRLIRAVPWFARVNGDIQADPSLWNEDQNLETGLVSKAQIFGDNGVELVRAKNKGQSADDIALSRLNDYYWADPYSPSFDPLFFICEGCTGTIDNFPNLVYEEWSTASDGQKSLKEKMRDHNVDEWDAFKYAEALWKDVPKYIPPIVPGSMAWYKAKWKEMEKPPPESGNLY